LSDGSGVKAAIHVANRCPDEPPRSATAAINNDTPLPFALPAVRRKKLTVDFDGGNQSSDAGLLLLREAERRLGVCRRLAAAMPDRREPDRVRYEMFKMVMAPTAAIACRYKDAIDHDWLRHDPLMKVTVGRHPQTGAPLASQSTISRLENAPSKTEAARRAVALLDQFGSTVKPGRWKSSTSTTPSASRMAASNWRRRVHNPGLRTPTATIAVGD
jgi:Transposase DDE domain group 1